MRDVVYKMITDTVEKNVDALIGDEQDKDEWDYKAINASLRPIVPQLVQWPLGTGGQNPEQIP